MQYLVKWDGCPSELVTWEDVDQVRHLLPVATACGQAVFQGQRDLTYQEDGKRVTRAMKPNMHHPGPEWERVGMRSKWLRKFSIDLALFPKNPRNGETEMV